MPGRSRNGGAQPAASASPAAAPTTTSRCTAVSRGGQGPLRSRSHSYHSPRVTSAACRTSTPAAASVRRNWSVAARVGVSTATGDADAGAPRPASASAIAR